MKQSSEGLWKLLSSPDAPVSQWLHKTLIEFSDIEKALEEVWKQAMPVGMKRYILAGPRAARLLRKYRPKPNFCNRKFKRRSKRK